MKTATPKTPPASEADPSWDLPMSELGSLEDLRPITDLKPGRRSSKHSAGSGEQAEKKDAT